MMTDFFSTRTVLRAVIVGAVCAAALYVNLRGRSDAVTMRIANNVGGYSVASYGWPLTCCSRSFLGLHSPAAVATEKAASRVVHFSLFRMLVDCVVFVLLAVSALVTARRLSPKEWRVQFRLVRLLSVTTVACTICTLVFYERSYSLRTCADLLPSSCIYYPITLYPAWIYIPVFVGVACSVFVALDTLGAGLRAVLRSSVGP